LGLLAALQFLTILPVRRNFTAAQIGSATVFFPIVGVILGAILVGLNYLLSLILPSSLVNIFLLVALVVLNGGLHLDGLADTIDGVAGHRSVERRLEIMKDSRIGGMGAVAIGLVLLVQYVALNNIPDSLKLYALLWAPMLSRWAMVNAIYVYPYVRSEGLGVAFKQGLNGLQYALDAVITLMVGLMVFRLGALAVMAFVWLSADLTAIYFKSKFRGLTGDTYGAVNEITFIAALLMINILAHNHWLI